MSQVPMSSGQNGRSASLDALLREVAEGKETHSPEETLARLRAEVQQLATDLGKTRTSYDAMKVGTRLNRRVELLKQLEAVVNQGVAAV